MLNHKVPILIKEFEAPTYPGLFCVSLLQISQNSGLKRPERAIAGKLPIVEIGSPFTENLEKWDQCFAPLYL